MILRYSTFQKLILPLITSTPIQGLELRKKLKRETGHRISGPKFYNWMHQLTECGLVKTRMGCDKYGPFRKYWK